MLARDPPPDLIYRAAKKESENEAARNQYMYRQTVIVQDFSSRDSPGGEYREVREVIFFPSGERTERLVGKPLSNLRWLKLTADDPLRELQALHDRLQHRVQVSHTQRFGSGLLA